MADVVLALMKRKRRESQKREHQRLKAQLKIDYDKLKAMYKENSVDYTLYIVC